MRRICCCTGPTTTETEGEGEGDAPPPPAKKPRPAAPRRNEQKERLCVLEEQVATFAAALKARDEQAPSPRPAPLTSAPPQPPTICCRKQVELLTARVTELEGMSVVFLVC